MGAGIRLAEGRTASNGNHSGNRSRDPSDDRIRLVPGRLDLERFENRLEKLEKKIAPLLTESWPADRGEASATQFERQLERQMEKIEARLRQDLGRRQEERLQTLSDGLQKRITERIDGIEAEIAGQRAAIGELRDCSLRTEQSLQKLLEGIDRLVEARTFPANANGPRK